MTDPATATVFEGHYIFTRDDYLALIMGLMSDNWAQFVRAMTELVTFNEVPFFVYVPLFGGLAAIALLPNLALLRAMRVYASLGTADQLIGVTLDEAGITTAAPTRQFRLDWSAVKRVIVRPDHLFLTMSRYESLMVPKRAFADAAEFAAVIALARRKVQAAKQT
jgi:hypothetical protein